MEDQTSAPSDNPVQAVESTGPLDESSTNPEHKRNTLWIILIVSCNVVFFCFNIGFFISMKQTTRYQVETGIKLAAQERELEAERRKIKTELDQVIANGKVVTQQSADIEILTEQIRRDAEATKAARTQTERSLQRIRNIERDSR